MEPKNQSTLGPASASANPSLSPVSGKTPEVEKLSAPGKKPETVKTPEMTTDTGKLDKVNANNSQATTSDTMPMTSQPVPVSAPNTAQANPKETISKNTNSTSTSGGTNDVINSADGKLTEHELQHDQNFMDRLADNIDEKRQGAAVGAQIEENLQNRPPITKAHLQQLPISEAEAKQLLADETDKLEQNLKQSNQKPHKTLMLVMTVAVIICITGVVFTLIMGSMNQKDPQTTNPPAQSQPSPEAEPSKPAEIVGLGLDNALVHGLYDQFDVLNTSNVGIMEFYHNGSVPSDLQKYVVALGNLSNFAPCQQTHEYLTHVDSDGTDQYNRYEAGQASCLRGEDIKAKMKDVFGGDYDLSQFKENQVIVGGEGFMYFADGDEAVNIASGATILSGMDRRLYKAEQNGDKIYLYEWATMPCIAMPGDEECSLYGGIEKDGDYGVNDYEQRYHRIDMTQHGGIGERINIPADVTLAEFETTEYKKYLDLLDKFKWTFTKDAAGHYIFEKITRIEE